MDKLEDAGKPERAPGPTTERSREVRRQEFSTSGDKSAGVARTKGAGKNKEFRAQITGESDQSM